MKSSIERRAFLTALGGAAASSLFRPRAAHAQQTERIRRIGILMGRSASDPEGQKQVAALQHGLEELGWVADRNVTIEYRWHTGDAGKAQALAEELLEHQPDLIVANSTPSLEAFRQAPRTLPIVFIGVADPVAQGFVGSLARPGGNITGFGLEEPGMGAKWVELVREVVPGVARITAIFNPDSAPYAKMFFPSMESARAASSVELAVLPVHNDAEIERTIVSAARSQAPGLIVLPDSFLFGRRDLIVALAARYRVPAVYPVSSFPRAGGLLSYGIDRVDLFRRAATYVDRILKGENPGDLPVQQPTRFELIVNLNIAKTLGLNVPATLLATADEVIE